MNLRTRITAAVVAASATGTLVLGGAAIAVLQVGQVGKVDQLLRTVEFKINSNPTDPISEATLAADESDMPLALGFVAPGTDLVWLRTLPNAQVRISGSGFVAGATAEPITSIDQFRVLAVPLVDGSSLILAASLGSVVQENNNNVIRLLLLWLPFNMLMALLVSMFVARELRQLDRLITAASGMAAGDDDVAFAGRASSTEVRTLSTALQQVLDSLQQAVVTERLANSRMQEFLGDASHELRTPLTVIKGYLELLDRSDGLDELQRERALDRMRTETKRMELLVDDLLLLAEIGSTRPEDLSDIDLTGLLRVMVDDFRVLQPERTVTSNIEAGLEVAAVASHLHRAIANAIANIRRHTPADAPVHVDLHRVGDEVQLTIEDGGPGLPEESYAKGIGHFQRFDPSRSRGSGGSGLGMSIMSAVVQELGGSVRLRKSDLGGLALDFTLPTKGN